MDQFNYFTFLSFVQNTTAKLKTIIPTTLNDVQIMNINNWNKHFLYMRRRNWEPWVQLISCIRFSTINRDITCLHYNSNKADIVDAVNQKLAWDSFTATEFWKRIPIVQKQECNWQTAVQFWVDDTPNMSFHNTAHIEHFIVSLWLWYVLLAKRFPR